MLYHFLYPLAADFPLFNLFKYITFRTAGAIFTALLISFIMGPKVINWLKKRQKHGQPIRLDGPQSHLLTKKGTPTMGGLLILIALVISTLLWGALDNHYIWIVMMVTLGFGFLGGIDDYIKLTKSNSKGLPGKVKLVGQIIISFAAIYWFMSVTKVGLNSTLAVPFFKNILIELSWIFIVFNLLVIVGSSNAVNLTDGLDGLAIVPVMITAGCMLIISYLVGNHVFASYLQLHFVPSSGELAVFCGALVGASLGFLWFNAPPAKVFMGDTGSLALGGALGTISMIIKHEIVLFIIGGLFVIETVSVIMQVLYFKATKRRIFLMAPIHHHFEKKGWAEQTIVIRFWIISIILALVGLLTLKLR